MGPSEYNQPDRDETNAGRLEAAELELERAHRLLDGWGVPREAEAENGARPVELSLVGRLELLPDGPDSE